MTFERPFLPAFYTLIGKLPVPCDDPVEWAKFYGTPGSRRVAETYVGPLRISTIFLALDHSFFEGPARLFETMIFDDGDDSYQTRCETWDEAEAMHRRAVETAEVLVQVAEASVAAFAKLFDKKPAGETE
jgi:hypothetical protein